MITPSFSLIATERVLPRLALDFTTANLDSRITFTRTTSATNPATYVDNSGTIIAATDNQPRFDYDPVTKICKGLLIEEQRTNSLLRSAALNAVVWSKVNTTVTENAGTAPDGTNAANKLEATTTAATLFYQAATITSTSATGSVYVKKGSGATDGNRFYLRNGTTLTNLLVFTINYDTQAITYSTGSTGVSVVPAGNGWYRVLASATSGITSGDSIRFSVCFNGASTNAGVYAYAWGAQLEAGAFPTSYIPTTSSALTRNADVATMTGTNFSDWWTATTGATNVLAIPKAITGTNPLFQLDDNTADNIISLRGNAANPELYIKATTDQAQIDAGTIVANTAYKLSGAWNTNDCAAAQNGSNPITDTSATIPTVTQARIGSDGTNYANAWLQKINYWPQRLTNAEVQAFSK